MNIAVISTEEIRFVDLFSGIGGIRLAFEQTAHSLNIESECVLSSEINTDGQLVYEKNFGHTALGDIRLIDKLPEHEFLLVSINLVKAVAQEAIMKAFYFTQQIYSNYSKA
ncbi:DNA cytosine methyltransferase [Nostoc flagelliforme]|uniref:DNA cytosine methyltransferase n=1 Tax=Nostoc flagelliforme TaxID=1306274 RepID=UPI001F54C388|nr:DNA cytosine methyltransferase [Nostoc flagelliforme]